jgi:tRNA(Ile)-lysidine synthase
MVLMPTLADRVRATISRYGMFHPGQSVGVAVSGGADSVALLHILVDLAHALDVRLAVLHLDHQLRGEESRADAAFVRDLTAHLGLPLHLRELDVARLAAQSGDNLEQAARSARYDFFGEFLTRGDLHRVALGHTRSDQAETVLFRFLRGAGTAGLAGIRPVTGAGIVRPLIEIHRADVEVYLCERGIPWREDSTNRSPDFARNRIRHYLLPQLTRDWNPSLPETLARTADWAQAEEAWWEREIAGLAGRLLTHQPPAVLARVEDLRALPLAVARRFIRRAIEMVKGDLRSVGFEHVETILAMASSNEGSGRTQAPGLDVYRSFDWLRLAPPGMDTLENRNFRLPLAVPGSVQIPGTGAVIHLQLMDNGKSSYNKEMGRLDWERVSGALELRNWRPGDQYHPAGGDGHVKIKTLFQDARIPLWERRTWPLITRGDNIVWTRRFGPAMEFRAVPESRVVLCIREAKVSDCE